jgi:hypothetical protein
LFCQLVDWVCEHNIPGDFTFDCYFTNAEDLNYIHAKKDRFGRPRGYVGDLKQKRKIALCPIRVALRERSTIPKVTIHDRSGRLTWPGFAAAICRRGLARAASAPASKNCSCTS